MRRGIPGLQGASPEQRSREPTHLRREPPALLPESRALELRAFDFSSPTAVLSLLRRFSTPRDQDIPMPSLASPSGLFQRAGPGGSGCGGPGEASVPWAGLPTPGPGPQGLAALLGRRRTKLFHVHHFI